MLHIRGSSRVNTSHGGFLLLLHVEKEKTNSIVQFYAALYYTEDPAAMFNFLANLK